MIVVLATVLSLTSYFISIRNFIKIEEGAVLRNFNRAVSSVQSRIDYLDRIASDWAEWDDTYSFAMGKNLAYVEKNLQYGAIKNLKLDFIAIADSSGKMIFNGYYNSESGNCEKFPHELYDYVTYELFARNRNPTENFEMKGILPVVDAPILFAARPILTSGKKGPVAGILFFGKLLDSSEMAGISEIIGFKSSFLTEKGILSSHDYQKYLGKIEKRGSFWIDKSDIDEIDGLMLFKDINDKPALILKIPIPRTILREGRNTVLNILGWTAVIILTFYIILAYMLEKTIFSGLRTIVSDLKKIRSIDDLSLRVSIPNKVDELFFLSRTLNEMIELLQISQANARISEEKRSSMEKFYKYVVEQAPCGIATCFIDGKMRTVNREFCQIVGYSEKEIMAGLDFNSRTVPEDWIVQEDKIGELVRTKEPVSYEKQCIRKDGAVVSVLVTISYYRDETGGPDFLICSFVDLTERDRLVKQEAHFKEQLAQAQQLDSLGRLAGGFSHDLNNLLVPIIGFTDLILKAKDLDEGMRRDLNEIKKAADKAKAMSKKILSLSSRQPIQMGKTNINLLIGSFMSTINTLKGEKTRLVLELEMNIKLIDADTSMMEQVVMNLVLNSKDAMPAGGTLTIGTSMKNIIEDPGDFIFHSENGEYVVLTIADTGKGIPPENIEHIFEPFYTTKNIGKGTGLGLSIVYGIVKQHRANLRVESSENNGTKFEIYFPAKGYGEVLTDTVKLRKIENFDFGNLKVLVVDDEEVARNIVASELRNAGCSISSVESAEAAIAKFANDKSFSLLLADVVMPGMNGKKLFETLEPSNPGLKVIYMSGYTMDILSKHDMGTSDNFIQKPFSVDELLAKIVSVMGD